MRGVIAMAATETAMHAITSRSPRMRRSIGAAAREPNTPKSSESATSVPISVPLMPMPSR
ncbi:hypothetical protein D3C83_32520 [compost metagenome]